MRRLVPLLGLLALTLAGLAVPASGQTLAPPTIERIFPACEDVGSRGELSVGGRSQAEVLVELFNPAGTKLAGTTVFPDGEFWGASLPFAPDRNGEYEVRASNRAGRASVYIQVPCQAPALAFDPSCFPVGYSGRVTMIGRHFRPFESGHLAEYDRGGSEAQRAGNLTADNHGVVRGVFSVVPSNRPHPGRISDANGGLIADGTWNACPPGPTTTTTTSTPVVPDTTTTTRATNDPVPVDTTTTTLPVDAPGTPVTVPPTVELPPPTVGATLSVGPELGPAGFVTGAVGTGFPPGPVTVTWSPGIGTTTAIVGPDGTFTTRVLVFPNDRLGPRALIATAGATTAYDAFLVVQSTVQPSGQDVQQINRIRRFNQR